MTVGLIDSGPAWPGARTMALSVDELRATAARLRSEGLNSQQIADELSLSQTTIEYLLAGPSDAPTGPPSDVRIGWRTIGVRPIRVDAIGSIMADIAIEELAELDTVVGISLNGILFAQSVAKELDLEIAIQRNIDGADGAGHLSNKYGHVDGRKVAIVDDVLSTGVTMSKTIEALRAAGAEVVLCMVLVNKTLRDDLDGVPLRGLIRAVPV